MASNYQNTDDEGVVTSTTEFPDEEEQDSTDMEDAKPLSCRVRYLSRMKRKADIIEKEKRDKRRLARRRAMERQNEAGNSVTEDESVSESDEGTPECDSGIYPDFSQSDFEAFNYYTPDNIPSYLRRQQDANSNESGSQQ